jgi:glycerol-3-phosphate dehydrogenase
VNATGPFCDSIRKMDDPECETIIVPSSGTHVVLPGFLLLQFFLFLFHLCFCGKEYFSPRNMGLLDPATSDGRVIFFVPWQGATVAGTTDVPCTISAMPKPSEAEIAFVLGEIKARAKETTLCFVCLQLNVCDRRICRQMCVFAEVTCARRGRAFVRWFAIQIKKV